MSDDQLTPDDDSAADIFINVHATLTRLMGRRGLSFALRPYIDRLHAVAATSGETVGVTAMRLISSTDDSAEIALLAAAAVESYLRDMPPEGDPCTS